jgi:hypothetical protein
MATRYKDRITILEDAEIEELYGRPRLTHDERVHYFVLTPEERAVPDGHYSLASRALFILQAGYFKAKTFFLVRDRRGRGRREARSATALPRSTMTRR